LLKNLNRSLILRLVRDGGPISRAEIAKRTKLSLPAVLKIVDGLVQDGYLRESGEGTSTGGRPPRLVEIDPEGAFAVGIELTPDRFRVGLADLSYVLRVEKEAQIDAVSGYQTILGQLVSTTQRVLSESSVRQDRVLGVGVAVPGLVQSDTGTVVVAANLAGWTNIPLAKDLSHALGLPVIIENDARACALAELWHGRRSGMRHFMSVDVEVGVGAGIVLNRELYNGYRGIAGEIGHIVVEENGKPCGCGKRGCLQTVASLTAMLEDVRSNPSPKLLELCSGQPSELDVSCLLEALRAGDRRAQEVIEQAGRKLGRALGNLMNVLDVETIIINSDIVAAGEAYLAPLREEVSKYFFLSAERPLRVVPSKLGRDAGLLGAVTLILREMFAATAAKAPRIQRSAV
jgi:predicted NBD/HSP70 family sugar kinase